LSYFSQSKSERDTKNVDSGAVEAKLDATAVGRKSAQEIVSTLGPGLLVTGNIVCTGTVQIFGRLIGDIHTARLLICKGAQVEGKVLAQDAVIDGTFKGTIHCNSVKLQATAMVEGEVFNKSLVIEQNAQFEGVSRRLTTPIEAPTNEQTNGTAPIPAVALVPDAAANQTYAVNGGARSEQLS